MDENLLYKPWIFPQASEEIKNVHISQLDGGVVKVVRTYKYPITHNALGVWLHDNGSFLREYKCLDDIQVDDEMICCLFFPDKLPLKSSGNVHKILRNKVVVTIGDGFTRKIKHTCSGYVLTDTFTRESLKMGFANIDKNKAHDIFNNLITQEGMMLNKELNVIVERMETLKYINKINKKINKIKEGYAPVAGELHAYDYMENRKDEILEILKEFKITL